MTPERCLTGGRAGDGIEALGVPGGPPRPRAAAARSRRRVGRARGGPHRPLHRWVTGARCEYWLSLHVTSALNLPHLPHGDEGGDRGFVVARMLAVIPPMPSSSSTVGVTRHTIGARHTMTLRCLKRGETVTVHPCTEALKTLESQGNPSNAVRGCDGAPLSTQMLRPNSARTIFATTDRGTDYGSEGRGFKSSWAYQSPQRVGGRLPTRRGQFPATAAVLRIRGLASTGAGRKSSPWIAASRTSMSDPLVTKAEIPAALMVRITSASSNEE